MKLATSSKRLCLTVFCSAALLFGSARAASAAFILIEGNSTGGLATATLDLTRSGDTITATLTNTSPPQARITGIGFDLPPIGNVASPSTGLDGFSGSVTTQPATASFSFSDAALGNVPQFNDAVLDFGFITGAGFSGGNPPTGLPTGTSLVFSVAGANFGSLTEGQIAASVFVRFQSVGENAQDSDVGVPDGDIPPPPGVPEPGSSSLIAVGLAYAWRHRRNAQLKSGQ